MSHLLIYRAHFLPAIKIDTQQKKGNGIRQKFFNAQERFQQNPLGRES